jgi:hypothetical protein
VSGEVFDEDIVGDGAGYVWWRRVFDCCGGAYPGEYLTAVVGLYCTGDPGTVHLRTREYV